MIGAQLSERVTHDILAIVKIQQFGCKGLLAMGNSILKKKYLSHH